MQNKQRVMSGLHLMVLLALHRRQRSVSAQEIGQDILVATGRRIQRPNIHKTLTELVTKGWVAKIPVEGVSDGRRRHSFDLNDEGYSQVESMAEGILLLGAMEAAEQGRRRRAQEQSVIK